MILFGVNFNVYYFILIKKFKDAIHYEELKYYLLFIGASVAMITYNIHSLFPTIEQAFRHALFQVGTVITTTGYASTDFNKWPEFSKFILVMLMFSGACRKYRWWYESIKIGHYVKDRQERAALILTSKNGT